MYEALSVPGAAAAAGNEPRLHDRPPIRLADPVPDPQRVARQVLALAERLRYAEFAQQRGRAWAVRARLLSPLRAAREALHAVRTYGRTAAEDSGTSRLRQFAWMWWLNMRYDYRHDTVYRFRLFSPDRVFPTPLFAQWHDAALMFSLVGQRTGREAAEILADKRRFARWCAEQDIRSPAILMEFEDGRVTGGTLATGAVPHTDLFAKWGTQYGGGDTRLWRFEDGHWTAGDGRRWDFDEIVAALTEQSRDGAVLLQARLVNHPELRRLSPNALSTIRVMTTRRPRELPRFVVGLLRMGTGTAAADNFAQGGIASTVDTSTGISGPARRLDKQHRTHVYEAHPDTHEPIAGTRVPYWEESIALALAAHERLGAIACVGWDVAVLEDGPVLLEGNWNPCTKLLQVATQTPLLATEVAATYLEWLAEPGCEFDDRTLVEQSGWSPV